MAVVKVTSDLPADIFSVPFVCDGVLGGVEEDEDEDGLEFFITIGPSVSSPSVVLPASSSSCLLWLSIKLERAYCRERTWLTVSAGFVPSGDAAVISESLTLNRSAE